MNYKKIKSNLLSWYDSNHREMPWRGESDAYKIWVSEIMLQQTQVSTVIDYYNKWVKQFPTIKDVANASLDDILKCWEGLGYYSRARNFHEACKEITQSRSKIPKNIILSLENVSISYGTFEAVRNVFCNFKKGNITSLIGPSGCGKSTVLRSLNRMNDLIPNCSLKGTVLFDGTNIYDKRVDPVEVRRRIGMVR